MHPQANLPGREHLDTIASSGRRLGAGEVPTEVMLAVKPLGRRLFRGLVPLIGALSMDYPLKVRLAVGPGIPFQLSRMQTPDAHKATLEAVFKLLTMGSIPAGYIAKATHGSTTACVSLTAHTALANRVVPFRQRTSRNTSSLSSWKVRTTRSPGPNSAFDQSFGDDSGLIAEQRRQASRDAPNRR